MLRNNVDAHISSLGYLWFLRLVFGQFFIFSLRYINVTLGLLAPQSTRGMA